MTDRPTIFFSHASADKQTLGLLKTLFGQKVGQSIAVFLSSDGQSIPLGRNWVHKIQEALDRAALMVIFITPGALASGWVHFEAGYAYSKGIRVVPVGFLGIDLSQLNPPLSLLQGFNINSADGLNNLIALANEVFDHKHSDEFTPEEFSKLIHMSGSAGSSILGAVTSLMEEASLTIEPDDLEMTHDQALTAIDDILSAHQISHYRGPGGILGAGLKVTKSSRSSAPGIDIEADPLLLQLSFAAIVQVIKKIRKGKLLGTKLHFTLKEGIEVVTETYKVAARLHDTTIAFDNKGGLTLERIEFDTGHFYRTNGRGAAYVCLTLPSNPLQLAQISALFAILHERGVIFTNDPWS